jgi:hypothetical protein
MTKEVERYGQLHSSRIEVVVFAWSFVWQKEDPEEEGRIGKYCTVAVFVFLDLQIIFCGKSVGMLMVYPHAKFHVHSSHSSLIITVKPKAKDKIFTRSPCCFIFYKNIPEQNVRIFQ